MKYEEYSSQMDSKREEARKASEKRTAELNKIKRKNKIKAGIAGAGLTVASLLGIKSLGNNSQEIEPSSPQNVEWSEEELPGILPKTEYKVLEGDYKVTANIRTSPEVLESDNAGKSNRIKLSKSSDELIIANPILVEEERAKEDENSPWFKFSYFDPEDNQMKVGYFSGAGKELVNTETQDVIKFGAGDKPQYSDLFSTVTVIVTTNKANYALEGGLSKNREKLVILDQKDGFDRLYSDNDVDLLVVGKLVETS